MVLPHPRRPHEHEELAVVDAEVEIDHGRLRAEQLVHALETDFSQRRLAPPRAEST